jgi:hypothetical protein
VELALMCSPLEPCEPSWLLLPDAVAKAACQSLSSRPPHFLRVVMVGYINILGSSEKDHRVLDDTEKTIKK